MSLEQFLELVKANGIEGLVIGLVVLVLVFAASAFKLTITGNQKRLANLILSLLLGGVALSGTTEDAAIVSAIASLASAGLYELIQWAARRSLPVPPTE